jgi:hydrogenase maturation protein HypF
MVENNVSDPVIGVSFDGTGYGTDGTIWGGEFLISTWKDFERAGHLRQVRLPGGEVAIEKPYRTAFSYLYTLFGEDYSNLEINYLKRLDPVEVEIMKKQIKTGLLSPLTSSSGRLFDAVSSLIGIRDVIEFEGQAAIEMEMLADEAVDGSYGFRIEGSRVQGHRSKRDSSSPFGAPRNDDHLCHSERSEESHTDRRALAAPLIVDTEPIIRGVVSDLQDGVTTAVISAKFHNTVVEFVTDMCNRLRKKTGINIVALSGGVFQNAYLLTRLKKRLKNEGFEVLTQKQVPANDGGISLGQAVIAHQQLIGGTED